MICGNKAAGRTCHRQPEHPGEHLYRPQHEVWTPLGERPRCRSVHLGNRCWLVVGHAERHAANALYRWVIGDSAPFDAIERELLIIALQGRLNAALSVLNHRGCTAESARLAQRILAGEPVAKLGAEAASSPCGWQP